MIPTRKIQVCRLRGFTLVELLVAMTVTTILMVALTSLTVAALEDWRQARDFRRYRAAAWEALDLLDHDIRSSIIRPPVPGSSQSAGTWLELRGQPTPNLPNSQLSLIARPSGGLPGSQGDVHAVHYRLASPQTHPTESSLSHQSLFRALINPTRTLGEVLPAQDPETEIWSAESIAVPENFIAASVGGFRIDLRVRHATGIQAIPASDGPVRIDRNPQRRLARRRSRPRSLPPPANQCLARSLQ